MRNAMTGMRSATLILAFCAIGVPAVAQQKAGGQGNGRPPPAVTVMTMQAQDVQLTTTLPGRVVASAEAEVRPQVAGIITERAFEEGEPVNEGDVLFRIDPAVYEAQVAQANAAVAQAEAQVRATSKEADRLQELSSRNVVSEQSLDSAVAARDSAAASLQAAQAQLQSAQISLDDTVIRARLSGEVGRSLISPGALVTNSQSTPLVIIRNIDPVYVDVTQSAAELLDWRRGNTAKRLGDTPRTVKLTLADGSAYDQTGTLTAAEPDVDQQTGVVVLRMEFANPDKLLLPGMYVRVEMPTGTAKGAFLVPQEAVSRDRRGKPIALVVNADNVVEQRQLTVLQTAESDWIVSDGLADGDRVIVMGLQKASPGATVTPQEQAAPESDSDTAANDAAPEKSE